MDNTRMDEDGQRHRSNCPYLSILLLSISVHKCPKVIEILIISKDSINKQ